jgi:RHS repeat-associated protein
MDDRQRIALVETRTLDTAGDDRAPRQLIRYQFADHLDSVALELDDQALIISYEEYSPYGSSTYQAVRSQTETAKRYRYTGKERDESSGLCYYGARYYIPWLGRWSSPDPEGLVDGTNVFSYVTGNPVRYLDEAGAARKDKSIDTLAGFEAFLQTTGKDHPILKTLSYGGKDLEEKSEHLKLYFHESETFPKVKTDYPGRTEVYPKHLEFKTKLADGKRYSYKIPDYRIAVRVFQGLTPNEMYSVLTHEMIHLQHELAIKESREKIVAENLAKSELWFNNTRDEGLKKSGTPVDQQDQRVSAEMTKRFGADVSAKANTEALAYSQAFAETYKQNKDVALNLLLEIQEPAEGLTFYSASTEAQGIAIKNIVGVASSLKELKELRTKFTAVFKDKKDPRFVDQVVNAIDAKIGDLSKKR